MMTVMNKNSRGMTMIEVMILLVVISLIGLGTTTMMVNLVSMQKRETIKSSMTGFRQALIDNLQNAEAWGFTVNHGSNTARLGCLRDNHATGCNDGPQAAGSNFRVQDSQNNVFYRADQATRGFTTSGANCNTFSAAGNDTCPYRYNLSWEARCPDGINPCHKPTVVITGTLVSRPNNPADPRFRLNTNLFNFTLNRGQRTRNEAFILRHQETGTNTGGGNCNAGGQVANLSEVGDDDPWDNVTVVGAGNNRRFRLQAGRYECRISGQAFQQPNGFYMDLRVFGGGVHSVIGSAHSFATYPAVTPSRGTAPDPLPNPPHPSPVNPSVYYAAGPTAFPTAHVTGTVYIDITQQTDFQIFKVCSDGQIPSDSSVTPLNYRSHGGTPMPPSARTLFFGGETDPVDTQYLGGLPVDGYGQGNVYTTVACIRTN